MIRLGCILLAAGESKRFGGEKLKHVVNNAPMLEYACALHGSLDYAARVMVVRPDDDFTRSYAERYGFSAWANQRFAQGIGTSAAAGMAALTTLDGGLDGALFAVCDQPFLTGDTVNLLMERFCQQPACIIAPVHNGKRGNPVIFPRSLFSEFFSLDGDKGGGTVIKNHPDLLRLVAVADPRELMDIDTRDAAKEFCRG